MTLSVDPHWPRAGDWPAPDGSPVDLALLGLPTFSTSLSPNSAFTTPAAIRAALRYYSNYVSSDRGAEPSPNLRLSYERGSAEPAGMQRGSAELAGVQRAAAKPGPESRSRAQRYADFGDATDPDGDEFGAIAFVARAAAAAQLVVALGGDNAATVAAARGTWGTRIATAGLITLDAHHDLRDGVSNGSPVRRLIEAGLAGTRVVQIGIADFANSAFYAERAADYGITVIHRDELHRRPMADVMAEALEIAAGAGGPVHVDVDVDVCDRSVAPACPASVPGGIAAHELRAAVRVAGRHPSVESIDFTEVDAAADAPDQRTVRLVALCVLEAAAGLEQRA